MSPPVTLPAASAGPAAPAPASPPRTGGDAFPGTLERILGRASFGEAEAEGIMDQVLQGDLGPERLAALVTALRAKGTTTDELVGFARSMRRHAQPFPHGQAQVVDTCGTGGAPLKSFNVSTTAAFVVAGAGLPVAKHGNRSVTRPSGSADVLEEAGARLDLPPAEVARVFGKVGIAFLFAPQFHPAMRHAAPVRKALGIRTVFNLLGPLASPAAATTQVLGVHDPALIGTMADALGRLGVRAGYVLHGDPGFDEAMPTGLVRYAEVGAPSGRIRTLDPASLGLVRAKPADLAPVPRQEAPALAQAILSGGGSPAQRDAVLLNAAFALDAGGKAAGLVDGLRLARESVASGAASAKWDAYLAETRGPR